MSHQPFWLRAIFVLIYKRKGFSLCLNVGTVNPGEVVWLLVLNTHSPRRQGLCAAFCVPDCSPGGSEAASPGSVGTVDPEELDLAFWLSMPFLKSKGQKEEGN